MTECIIHDEHYTYQHTHATRPHIMYVSSGATWYGSPCESIIVVLFDHHNSLRNHRDTSTLENCPILSRTSSVMPRETHKHTARGSAHATRERTKVPSKSARRERSSNGVAQRPRDHRRRWRTLRARSRRARAPPSGSDDRSTQPN